MLRVIIFVLLSSKCIAQVTDKGSYVLEGNHMYRLQDMNSVDGGYPNQIMFVDTIINKFKTAIVFIEISDINLEIIGNPPSIYCIKKRIRGFVVIKKIKGVLVENKYVYELDYKMKYIALEGLNYRVYKIHR